MLTQLKNNQEKQEETKLVLLPKKWKVMRLGEVLKEANLRLIDSNFKDFESDVLSLNKNFCLIPQRARFKYKVVKKEQIIYNTYFIWEGAILTLKTIIHNLMTAKIRIKNFKYDMEENND